MPAPSTFSLDDINGLAAMLGLLTTIAAVGIAWGSNRSRINEHERRLNDKRMRLAKIEQEAADFREKVAREYVNRDALRELEDRLVGAIERLGDRFDRYFDERRKL